MKHNGTWLFAVFGALTISVCAVASSETVPTNRDLNAQDKVSLLKTFVGNRVSDRDLPVGAFRYTIPVRERSVDGRGRSVDGKVPVWIAYYPAAPGLLRLIAPERFEFLFPDQPASGKASIFELKSSDFLTSYKVLRNYIGVTTEGADVPVPSPIHRNHAVQSQFFPETNSLVLLSESESTAGVLVIRSINGKIHAAAGTIPSTRESVDLEMFKEGRYLDNVVTYDEPDANGAY